MGTTRQELKQSTKRSELTPVDKVPDKVRFTDQELLRSYQQSRDVDAFSALVQRHYALVFGIANRMLGCTHSAEDVAQATFLVLAKNSRKIRKRHSVVSWLYGVAYRISARTIRQLAKTTPSEMEDRIMVSVDPLEKLTSQHEQEIVFDELHRLTESMRGALVLRYLKGKTNAQIAEELGLSESAVEGRLRRGRKQLRLRLARRGVAYGLGVGLLELVHHQSSFAASIGQVQHAIELANLVASSSFSTVSLPESGLDPASTNILQMANLETTKMVTAKLIAAATFTTLATITVGAAVVAGNLMTMQTETRGQMAVDAVVSNSVTLSGGVASSIDDAPQLSDPFGSAVTTQVIQQEDPFGGNSDAAPVNTNQKPASDTAKKRIRQVSKQEVGEYSADDLPMKELQIQYVLKNMRTNGDFYETRLEEVVEEIGADFNIPIRIDPQIGDYTDVTPETLITLRCNDMLLENALELMLSHLDVTTIVDNEVLLITSNEQAQHITVTRAYRMNSAWPCTIDEIQDSIQNNINPHTWQNGNGSITKVSGDVLVITAPHKIHGQVNDLLGQLERLYQKQK